MKRSTTRLDVIQDFLLFPWLLGSYFPSISKQGYVGYHVASMAGSQEKMWQCKADILRCLAVTCYLCPNGFLKIRSILFKWSFQIGTTLIHTWTFLAVLFSDEATDLSDIISLERGAEHVPFAGCQRTKCSGSGWQNYARALKKKELCSSIHLETNPSWH